MSYNTIEEVASSIMFGVYEGGKKSNAKFEDIEKVWDYRTKNGAPLQREDISRAVQKGMRQGGGKIEEEEAMVRYYLRRVLKRRRV